MVQPIMLNIMDIVGHTNWKIIKLNTYIENRNHWPKIFQYLLSKSAKSGSKAANHSSKSAKVVKLQHFW